MKFEETVNDEGIVLVPINSKKQRVVRGRRKQDNVDIPTQAVDWSEYYRLLDLQNQIKK